MPVEDHYLFVRPDLDALIWRYMDFTKFVALLETTAVYFPRVDLLGDPFEGSVPRPSLESPAAFWAEQGFPQEFAASMSDEYRVQRKYHYVSSWHIAKAESAAMWRLYLKSDEGIAIRSTTRRLCESFQLTEWRVFIGCVRYIDYEAGLIPEGNMFYPFLHKRESFEHEHELRAMIPDFERREAVKAGNDSPPGINVVVPLQILVESIWVAPSAPKWIFELVEAVRNRYGLDVPVHQSALAIDPLF